MVGENPERMRFNVVEAAPRSCEDSRSPAHRLRAARRLRGRAARARRRPAPRRARRGRAAARTARVRRDRRHGRPDERQRRGRASLARRREGPHPRGRRARRPLLGLVPRRAAARREPRRPRLRRAGARGRGAAGRAHRRRPPPIPSSPGCRDESPRSSGTATRSTCPTGAVLLATSPAYPNQAFRVGRPRTASSSTSRSRRSMAREWATVPEYAAYAERDLGPGGSAALARRASSGGGRDAGARGGGCSSAGSNTSSVASPLVRDVLGARRVAGAATSRSPLRAVDGGNQVSPGRLGVDLGQLEAVGLGQRLREDRAAADDEDLVGGAGERQGIRERGAASTPRPGSPGRGSRRWCVRPGSGRPIDSYVLRPMISAWPIVSALKCCEVLGQVPRQPAVDADDAVARDRGDERDPGQLRPPHTAIGALIAGCGS